MTLSSLRIAWRNLGRNRKRTALALAAIAVGQFGLLAYWGLMHGMSDSIRDVVTGPLVGHAQIHHPEWREERAMDLVVGGLDAVRAGIAGTPDVENVAPRIYGPSLVALGKAAQPALVLGLDPEAESDVRGLLAGVPEGRRPAAGSVVLGKVLAGKLKTDEGRKLETGDRIAVIGYTVDEMPTANLFEVAGVIDSPSDMVNRLGVLMCLKDAQEHMAMPDQAHEIVVHGGRLTDSYALAERLSGAEGLEEAEVLPWEEVVPTIAMLISVSDKAGLIILVVVFIASAAGIANTMLMSTFERLHEFGMLLALGTSPRRIVRMVYVEAVLLGLMGAAVGTLVGTGLVGYLGSAGVNFAGAGAEAFGDLSYQGMRFPTFIYPRNEITDAVYGAAAVVLTSILAAMWPASYAARLDPMEAMRS
jgi:ABC-type lipoprotein release transport system permease subunit